MEIGSKISVVSGPWTGESGIISNVSGPVFFVALEKVGIRPYYAEELEPVRKTSKLATKYVFRNLDKDVGGLRDAWEQLIHRTTTFQEFRKSAISWLKDHSELKGDTIENADWVEVYTWYKNQCS